MQKLCSLLIFWLHFLTVPTPCQKKKIQLSCTPHDYSLTHLAIIKPQTHVAEIY